MTVSRRIKIVALVAFVCACTRTDPRVKCPPGTKQVQDEYFGISTVECMNAEGIRHGPRKQWHSNGQIYKDMTYKDGRPEGISRTWHKNGKLDTETPYLGGEVEGVARAWHPNGQKSMEWLFHKGKPVAAAKNWDENGQLEPEEGEGGDPKSSPGKEP